MAEFYKGEGHQNLIKIFCDGWHDNLIEYYYIDMELCDLNLHEYIHEPSRPSVDADRVLLFSPVFVNRDCPLAENMLNIWTIMLHIAQGLEYLHTHKFVHRDLKPSNGKSLY